MIMTTEYATPFYQAGLWRQWRLGDKNRMVLRRKRTRMQCFTILWGCLTKGIAGIVLHSQVLVTGHNMSTLNSKSATA